MAPLYWQQQPAHKATSFNIAAKELPEFARKTRKPAESPKP
jgi:hypothetical protein